MGRLKKTAAVIMAVCTLLLCSGCDKSIKITTGLKDDVIFKLSDEESSLSQILLVLINEKDIYDRDFGQEIWSKNVQDISMEESVKEEIKEQQIYIDAICLMAEKKNIVLTEEEEQEIEAAAKEYFDTLTDEEIGILGITADDVAQIYKKNLIGKKVYESIAENVDYEVSDEEARVMSAMYIYIEGTSDESYEKALEAYESVDVGADFYTVAEEYSDDAIIQIEIGRDSFLEAIEAEVFSLSDGEYTGVLETENGYYIIKCIDSYLKSETESNKELILTNKKNEEFLNEFTPFLEELELDFNDKVWDSISLSDYAQCTTVSLFEVYDKYFDK